MRLQTLGELRLVNGEETLDLKKPDLIVLAFLVIEYGTFHRRKDLAERVWYTTRDHRDDGTQSLAMGSLTKSLSRIKRTLIKATGMDFLASSNRKNTVQLDQPIACDYVDLRRELDREKTGRGQSAVFHAGRFMDGIEYDTGIDIARVARPHEHPLFMWIRNKRRDLGDDLPAADESAHLLTALKEWPLERLLDDQPSPYKLEALYQLCLSPNYPFDTSQRQRDLRVLEDHVLNDLEYEVRLDEVPDLFVLLCLVALTGGYASAVFVERALEEIAKTSSVEDLRRHKPGSVAAWFTPHGLLLILEDQGYLAGTGPSQVVPQTIIAQWLTRNPRRAARYFQALVSVLPVTEEKDAYTSLLSSNLNLIMQVAGNNPTLLLQAAERRAETGYPEESAKLLEYGLRNVHWQRSQRAYAQLLLASARERSGAFSQALEVLEALECEGEWQSLPTAYPLLPSTPEDQQALKNFLLLRSSQVDEKTVVQHKYSVLAIKSRWARAKTLSALGLYYQVKQVQDSRYLETALSFHKRAAASWQYAVDSGHFDQAAGEKTNLANTLALAGQFAKAEAEIQASLVWMNRTGVPLLAILRAQVSLAAMYQNQKKFDEALSLYESCLNTPGAERHPSFLMRVVFNQAVIYDLDKGTDSDRDLAVGLYDEARRRSLELGDLAMRGRALASIGIIKLEKDLVDQGIDLIIQSGDTSDLQEYVDERNRLWPA